MSKKPSGAPQVSQVLESRSDAELKAVAGHGLACQWFGATDYDIPRFGFASAAVAVFAMVLAFFFIPDLFRATLGPWQLPSAVLGGMAIGFSIAIMQFFHEESRGPVRAFWWVGGLLSLASALVLFVIFCCAY